MEDQKRYYPVNMFRVCIDRYQEDISGRVCSPVSEEDIPFSGIGELLVKMDKLFDDIGYPQAFQDKRSFEEEKSMGNVYRGIPEAVRDVRGILEQKGICCTYDISVESRRNTSWQGVIYDVAGGKREKFKGEVELLEKLMFLAQSRV